MALTAKFIQSSEFDMVGASLFSARLADRRER